MSGNTPGTTGVHLFLLVLELASVQSEALIIQGPEEPDKSSCYTIDNHNFTEPRAPH